MKKTILGAGVTVLLLLAHGAAAEDKPAAAPPPAAAAAAADEEAPYRQEILDAARNLSGSFNAEQENALMLIRNGFGMVRAVGLVGKDVANAVAACGRDNPDMADQMSQRFAAWQGTVDPLIEKNRQAMKDSIHASGFPDEKKVSAYLDLIDKAAAHADSKIVKNIVTTKETCAALLASMDETEPTMTALLGSIVWPGVSGEEN